MDNMEQFVVYKITNLINNKIYIGMTNDFKRRIKEHKIDKRGDFPIKRAFKKYGKENFKFEIIEVCDNREIMATREKFYILKYGSFNNRVGYNATGGGEGVEFSENIAEKSRRANISSGKRSKINRFKGVKPGGIGYVGCFVFIDEKYFTNVCRTEVEAAWNRDLLLKKMLNDTYDIFFNFPDGKTEELIKEQLATDKMVEIVKYNCGIVKYRKEKNTYGFHYWDIKNDKRMATHRWPTELEANEARIKFIMDNKATTMQRNSVVAMQREFERWHGSIYDLITLEELEQAYKNQVGKFE